MASMERAIGDQPVALIGARAVFTAAASGAPIAEIICTFEQLSSFIASVLSPI